MEVVALAKVRICYRFIELKGLVKIYIYLFANPTNLINPKLLTSLSARNKIPSQ